MTTYLPTSAPSTVPARGRSPEVPEGRGWAYAGLGAGLAGITGIAATGFSGAVYQEELAGDAVGITQQLGEQTTPILVFHVSAMLSALLLLVFAAGLRRRLTDTTSERSLLPQVAGHGLLLVSVALLMGSALTTEFVFAVREPDLLVAETAVMFGHWINTVPWVWAGAGVAALAVGQAGRSSAGVPRWLTWASLGLGVVTTLFALSPLQYMAGMTGPLWVTLAAIGLVKKP